MGVDLEFLHQEVCPSLRERQERALYLEDGHHVMELAAEAMEEREHHLTHTDGVTKLDEGCSHGLKAAVVVGDAQGLLRKL